ncbi:MAG TPA: histidine phosphatase family protein [Solirubrobacteraceae bacterium]|jgi:probable phosphoglycerate mutase
MSAAPAGVFLVRHAETEWTIDRRHTGRTDIPLTERGREAARTLPAKLPHEDFALVLTSPSRRARETCELAGFGELAQVRDDLLEWDYGEYEGLTTEQILAQRPDWDMWRDGCPGGEGAADVGARADRVIEELRRAEGPGLVFSHGHVLRVLGARWAEMGPEQGARLALSPGAVCRLGHEHGRRVLERWSF